MAVVTGKNGLAERISYRLREIRKRHLRELLLKNRILGKPLRVIDLGGRYSFWHRLGLDFLDEHGIEVTILNLNADEHDAPPELHPAIRLAVGDACSAEFPDGAFDFVVSNSVIEHLGSWQNMIDFAASVRRLGRAYYCQTPNFWFPVDPHHYKVPFFHFLPRPSRAWIVRNIGTAAFGRASSVIASYHLVDSARLLCRSQMAALFPDATLRAERILGLFVKSYIAIGVPACEGDR